MNRILITILSVSISLGSLSCSESYTLNQECRKYGKEYIKDKKDLYSVNAKFNFFYSKRLDTCIMTVEDRLANEYYIQDIKNKYLRDTGTLFDCSDDGCNSVILENAEKYDGWLFNVSYSEWLDNGEGGEPATLKTPEKLYTREKCKSLFEQKIKEIK